MNGYNFRKWVEAVCKINCNVVKNGLVKCIVFVHKKVIN